MPAISLLTPAIIFTCAQLSLSQSATCVAGTFSQGHTARVTCYFGQDIQAAATDFNVGHYPSFTFDEPANSVLACNWIRNVNNVTCNVGPGFAFDYIVKDSLDLVIPTVSKSMEGTYVCSLVSPFASQPAPCNLTVTELFADTASGAMSGALLSTAFFIGLVAALGVLFTTTVILAIGCICIRIKYRLERRTELGPPTEELQDDWVNIVCCNISTCCILSAPTGTLEEQTHLQSDQDTYDELKQRTEAFPAQYSEYDTPFSSNDRALTFKFTEDASDQADVQLEVNSTSQAEISTSPVLYITQEESVHCFEVVKEHSSSLLITQMEGAESNDMNETGGNLEAAAVARNDYNAEVSKPVGDNDEVNPTDLFLQAVASKQMLRSVSRLDNGFCLLCENQIKDPKAFSCGHKFCTVCLDQWVKIRPMCPKCGTIEGVLYGDQPRDGHMAMFYSKEPLLGHDGSGSFVIRYSFPAGHQSDIHPHPDRPYDATEWIAYLPDTEEGRTVLMLLKIAFDRRLIFTMGPVDARLVGEGVVWSDIHHQTSRTSTEETSGPPVSIDFKRTISELERKGVTEKDFTGPQLSFIRSQSKVEGSTCDTDVDFSFLFEILSKDLCERR